MTEQQVLQHIVQEMEGLSGHLGFWYKNLATGVSFGIRENEPYLAASVIKLPVYLHVLKMCAEGNMRLTDRITVEDKDKMPSCGALTLFTGPVTADLETLCRLMIVLSDNTATNVLIRHCGIDAINQTIRGLGLQSTVLRRLLFDMNGASNGLRNVVSPREMGDLLEMLHFGQFISPETSRMALDTLLLQQIDHKLDGKLQQAVPMAHKTGEDDGLSNDVGLILAREPFILCFTGHDTDRYPWEDLMRRAAYDLVQVQNC